MSPQKKVSKTKKEQSIFTNTNSSSNELFTRLGLPNRSFDEKSGELKNSRIINMLTGISTQTTPLPFKNDDTNKNLVKLNDLYRKKEKIFLYQKDANTNFSFTKNTFHSGTKETELRKTPTKSREESKGTNKYCTFNIYN